MASLRAPLLRLRPSLAVPRITTRSNSTTTPPPPPQAPPAPRTLNTFLTDTSSLSRTRIQRTASSPTDSAAAFEFPTFSANLGSIEDTLHHLNVYATKHNTHITLTKPNKDVILTLSCGNVGFKKANRGTFEAAYQLSSVMFQRMEERGIRPKNIEVVFRDFGPGRDAFTKVLLGKEGKGVRESVVRVTDATRLKFGGTRSRAIRRL